EYKYDDFENIKNVVVNGLLEEEYFYTDAKLTGKSKDGVYEQVNHDAAGNISTFGARQYVFDDSGMLELHRPASGPGYEYRYSGEKRKTLVLEDGVPSVLHVYSSVLGKTLYSKSLRTGVETDKLFYESNLVAMIDQIPDDDTDGDLIPDAIEIELGLDPVDSSDAQGDLDGDSLSNLDELNLGLLPSAADSDGDGMPDGVEVAYGLDPTSNDYHEDLDGDGLSNGVEVALGWDP